MRLPYEPLALPKRWLGNYLRFFVDLCERVIRIPNVVFGWTRAHLFACLIHVVDEFLRILPKFTTKNSISIGFVEAANIVKRLLA